MNADKKPSLYDRHPRVIKTGVVTILATLGLATEIVPLMDYDKQVETPEPTTTTTELSD